MYADREILVENTEVDEDQPPSYNLNDSNILQPAWVRCAFRPGHEVDRFLLDYGLNFLLPVGVILWTILLLTS
jgi:hypothetical protein